MKKIFTSFCFIAALAISSNAQTVIISTGTAGTPAYNAGPVYRSAAASAFDASRYTYLYTASELAAAGITSGSVINLVGWVKNNTATSLGVGGIFRIYMKNTSAANFSLASETWANLNTGAILVYENLTQTIPATAAPTYIDFPLTTSFTYTGGSLEISTEWDINQVSGNASTGTFEWLWSTVVDRIYGTGNTTLAPITTLSSTTNSISTIDDRRPFIKITYTGGTTGIDVGAQSLVAPAVAANNCYTSAEPVTIRVRNFSTNPIDFSVNPMTVTTNVTGAVTQTLTAVVNTGTLAAAATLDVPMTGTLNMNATGVYTFNASTTVTGDVTPGNNAMTAVNITKAALAAGTASASPGAYCVTGGTPTLSTAGATGFGSLQWQESTTPAVGFTNIAGATTTPFTLSSPITQTMYYRLIASCNGNNVTSNETSVILNNPQITGTTPGASCGPGPVTVSLAATGTGTTFNWYAASAGGLPIGTGSPFTTPAINTNTTYYVSASTGGGTANLGLPAKFATASSGAGTTNFGLVFDALVPFTLNSVVVYPIAGAAGTPGTVTIDVISSTGAVLNTATVNVIGNPVASATAQTVTLNFNIAAGTNLKLRPGSRTGITGLLFEPSASAPAGNYGYPFVTPGVVSINHSTLTAAPANTARLDLYYYFYNWAIATGCESPRTAVLASITTPPSATISYAGSPYCSNAGTATVTQTGTAGGSYSSTAGLTINPSTGDVTLGTSTPGTYTITYTVAASGGCPVYTTTTSITITAVPNATISYAGSPYCVNAGTATVTQTGSAGGTYSSTAGLTLNTATGDVTLGTSTPGTYTVTYTVPAAGGCALFSTTASITINAAPTATIVYAGSPYCTISGTANVTQTGTAGGTYTATPAGLTLNAATGEITLGTSTPATYTVTYTIAASGGCAVFTTTTSITVINCLFPCVETFDGVIIPAFPISWSATVGATCVNTARWATVNTTSSSAPNSAFVNDPNCISDEYLDSRIFTVSATPSVLTFRNSYDLEASTVTPTLGFDGMVLEISINGGAFTDIITAGGSFVAGGYNRSISASFSSPIAGRQAWSGNSAGFITTTVNLPAAALGQNVVFRWRRATDSSVGAVGANIDDVSVTSTATIAYTGSPYCSNAGTATVTRTGAAGGTYSAAPAGLTLNASTGDVALGTSTPGTYTVTYTIAASGGCPAFTTTASITINAAPAATISYASNPYCQNAGTATVTQTGTAGGAYSSTAGLTLNASTGAVTLGTSTPGTYTVTYTIPAAGPCAAFTTSTSITVNALPSATINYPGSPYCSNAGTATVTRTGTSGGTYTAAPAGLTINAATGAVTLGTSAAGTYTVTYTIAAAGGCPAVTATATISITAAAAATISYAGSPYCSTVPSAPVTRTGTAGGTYTAAPAGLTINAATGTVTPNTSIPGTYTVSYTIPATAPCPGLTVTTSITITAAPSMTIFYAGTPYCSNAGTATVSQFGTTGGTYSAAPAGLSINATTGAVTLGTSTPGTYTVTYSVTATGCGTTITTTTITITAAPAATIAYTASPYCSNAGTANVTRTGTAGGTYSSTTGLTLNATTGAVTLGTSTPGTYTVSYTIAASGGCAAFTTTASITITALPAATISYAGSPYCSNGGTATVTRTGTAGGTFTATPAGLVINAATGDVNLGTSTAGTYTVTYTVAAGGGCPVVTATTTISITTLPAATITYAGNPYCQNAGTANVTRTGTAGGTYTGAPAGLTINATTGAVTLGTSTPGTYTVTYTIAAGGGCGLVTATASITVSSLSAAPTAATASSTSLCGPTPITLSVTGGSLGTGATWRWYSGSCGGTAVGTGATLNITPTATTTYFVRAEGACNTTTCANVTVTVNTQPTISITTSATTLQPGQTATLTATVSPAAGNTITWYMDGVVVAGASGLTLVVGADGVVGTYTARATTASGCTALSNAVTINATATTQLFITPNPNNGQFKVRYYTNAQQLGFLRHLVMFAENGQKVFDQTYPITAPYSSMNVDARRLPKGIYIVMLTDAFGKEVLARGKVVIQ